MSKTRFGVMGCAAFARRAMIPAILACKQTELVAVASRDRAKAAEFARLFGCEGMPGYASLLERDDVDAVYMPLPTGIHLEWVTKALEAGKHVLVEKSFSVDYESAEKMIQIARSRNLLVVENFLFPHHSQHAWITDFIRQGRLGDIHLFRSTFGFPPFRNDNIRYKPELGGGALLDVGAYVVKAAQLFLGNDLELIGASLTPHDEYGVDFYGEAMYKNAKSQVAQLAFGFNYFYQCNYEILGTKGKLTVNRSFTPPPGFRPTVRFEAQDASQEFSLDADDHYANMILFFTAEVAQRGDFTGHYEAILRQAKYLDEIRKAAAT